MTKTVAKKILLASTLAAGLGLVASPPARAQFFFDIFQPPPPQWHPPRVEHSYSTRRRRTRHYVRHSTRRHRREHAKRETAWDPKSVKGPYQVVIAIGPQEALLYGQDGLIGRASISTGRPDKPTPKGVFSVISKSRWHRSNIYSGAPMPWMQRITWSGVAMHEGPRPGYPASHGCIRLPRDFAVRLYHTTKVGTRVVVTRDAVAPAPIESPKLFVPKEPKEKPITDLTAVVVADADSSKDAAKGATEDAMSLAGPSSGSMAADDIASAGKSSEDEASDAKPSDMKSSDTQSSDTKAASGMPSDPPPAGDDASADAKPNGDALPDGAKPAQAESSIVPRTILLPPALPAHLARKRNGPVSVFVSLKQKKVFVRQGFDELFDMPVTITDPDRPIGTHIYTAMGLTEHGEAMRWTAISVPSSYRHHRSRRHRHGKDTEQAKAAPSSAAEALDRITLPPEAIERIDEMLTPGSSLIVSDNALSDETDDSTNFIVRTR